MESWRTVWRDGIDPLLSAAHLEALRGALLEDDPRLLQGATSTPPPYQSVLDWPVEATCGLAYMGWQGDGLKSVGEAAEFFARLCYEIDQRMNEPAVCRFFLIWYDDAPRDEMRRLLLAEVERSLALRAESALAETGRGTGGDGHEP